MRRVIVILLALVLAPSIATASWYRCAYDGATRSACCCPATTPHHKDAPARDPSVRAACCCTVTTTVAVAQAAPVAPAPFDIQPSIIPTVVPLPVVIGPAISIAMLDRPHAESDPPRSLFARHTALLL
ncbi:MAG: hypothetical protein ABI467_13450 [Kofleriaceae bacterium]